MIHPLAALATTAPEVDRLGAGVGSPMAGLGHVVLSLIIVVAIIFAMAWLFKRARAIVPGSAKNVRVVTQIPVGRKERVVLIQAGECQLLIGVAPGRVEMLHVLDQPVDVPITPQATQRFTDILSGLRSRKVEK